MPREIGVFILEDKADWVRHIKKELIGTRFIVIGESETIEGARRQIPIMVENNCQVLTLDGGLKDGYINDPVGLEFISAVKATLPNIRLIAVAGEYCDGIAYDADVGKDRLRELVPTLNKLQIQSL